MFSLVKQSIVKRKVNSFSLCLTVALAVATIVTLAVVYGGVQAGVAQNKERSGAQLMVVSREAANEISSTGLLFTGAPAPIYFPQEKAQALVADNSDVVRSTVQFYGQTLDESCCSTSGATRLIGIDFTTDWTVAAFAHEDLSAGIGDNRIICGCGAGGQKDGTVYILGKPYRVLDVLEPSGTELDTSIMMDIQVVRTISASQEDFAHYWEQYGNPADIVSCLLIDYGDTAKIDLQMNRATSMGLTAIQRSQVVDQAQASLSTVFQIMLIVGILLVISTAVQLFARFYGCVWERKSELALYRALGASKAQLRKLILAEIAVLLGTGVVVGALAGVILQGALVSSLAETTAFPFVALGPLQIAAVIIAIAIGFAIIGIASVVWPLSQINRLQPSVAMQQADID